MHTKTLQLTTTAILLASALTGCFAEQTCTLIGCASQLHVSTPWITDEDRFTVEVESDPRQGSFDCVKRDAGGYLVENQTGAFAVEGADGLVASCSVGGGVDIAMSDEDLLTSMTISVTTSAESRSGTFGGIDYERSTPNGEGCEPVCFFAEVTVD